jgi:SSS family solute:Na+ symporter
MQCTRVSIILYLVSIVIREMTGIDPVLSIYLGGIITALYTVMGGIRAVIWSDFIQAVIFIVGGFIVMLLIAARVEGGFTAIVSEAYAAGKFGMQDIVDGKLQPVPWGIDFTQKTVTLFLIAALSKWLYEYSANQNVIQRYVAARSTRDARIAMLICLLLSIPTWAMFMFIGTSLWVFFNHHPTQKAADILSGANGAKAEQILPHFVIDYLPQGFTGLLIAAVLAAAMSTLSSNISAVSSVGLVDVYKRHLLPGRTDTHYLWAARAFGVLMAIIMIAGAVFLNSRQNSTLQDVATAVEQLTLGGLLGLYLLGFFTRVGDDRSVLVGIACTIGWSLWQILSNFKLGGQPILPAALISPVHSYYAGLIGHTIMFIVGYTMARLIPRRGGDLRNLTIYTQDATPAD